MKITFIGAGRVGSATAFSVIHAVDAVDKIVMLDLLADLAKGEAEDLTHAAHAMERGHVKITGTNDYKETKASDIYVVTAGLARKPGQTREDLAKINYKIINAIGKNIKKGVIITATNPLDSMNYAMWKATGLPRQKIIGMGGILDTARLHSLGYDGFIIGTHGLGMVPTEKVPAKAMKALNNIAPEIIKRKGGTIYGPAISLSRMIYAIINDTNEVLPCSCILDGEYGLEGLSIGVPANLGRPGIQDIIEIDPPSAFNKSAEAIKSQITALGL